MSDVSKSPERNTFQRNALLARAAENRETPDQDTLEMYAMFDQLDIDRESDPEWKKNNLEYDLRSTDWILEKVRNSEVYAQNVYAALCNIQWQKLDVLPILKDEWWTCSWRSAGGIVADMRQEGDYIDWYCSGIRGTGLDDESFNAMSKEKQEQYIQEKNKSANYVEEGIVTQEIEDDFKKLGWQWSFYQD